VKTIFSNLEKETKQARFLFALLLVVIVFIIDHLLGRQIRTSILLMLPVVIASWYGSARTGIFLCFIISVIWIIYYMSFINADSFETNNWWNFVIVIISCLIVSITVGNFKKAYLFEENAADTDKLTGLSNLRGFYEKLTEESHRARRYKHKLSVVYIDIDNFKKINDSLGHDTGDQLLKEVATILLSNFRDTDTVGRIGGDEFVCLLPETESSSTKNIVLKVISTLSDSMKSNGWDVSFSIGVVSFEQIPNTIKQTLKIADELMYTIKNGTKDDVAYIAWSGDSIKSS